jgi:hypothetical protein
MSEYETARLRLECLNLAAQLLEEDGLPYAVDHERNGHPQPSTALLALADALLAYAAGAGENYHSRP